MRVQPGAFRREGKGTFAFFALLCLQLGTFNERLHDMLWHFDGVGKYPLLWVVFLKGAFENPKSSGCVRFSSIAS
jgi:hypothetical protein